MKDRLKDQQSRRLRGEEPTIQLSAILKPRRIRVKNKGNVYFPSPFFYLSICLFFVSFSGLFNTAPKKPNSSPVSIRYTQGVQQAGPAKSDSDSNTETSPGVVDR